jgi:hypothetical protein
MRNVWCSGSVGSGLFGIDRGTGIERKSKRREKPRSREMSWLDDVGGGEGDRKLSRVNAINRMTYTR